jgi:hypothetical protein
MEYYHKQSPTPYMSAGMIMASVFWDAEVIHVNFLPHGITINAQYYNNSLCNDVHQVT